jgi:hypothetical protein
MTASKEAEISRFFNELEQPKQQRLVILAAKLDKAQEDTNREDCDFCVSVMDGEGGAPPCEHYDRLHEAFDAVDQFNKLECGGRSFGPAEELASYSTSILTPDWDSVPEGYYAVPDPGGQEEMTYWVRKTPPPGNKRGVNSFGAWPSKARYGTQLLRSDLPENLDADALSEKDYVKAWFRHVSSAYRVAVAKAILEDPREAAHRFADWAIRCCCCGRKLTNDLSKVYGIGPECRKGMSGELLANYYRPEVGRLHASEDAKE